MRKFKAVDAVCIMVLAGIVGFFMGAFLDNSMGGAILFSMIAGFACVVHAIGDREEWMKRKSERKRRENAKEV